MFGDGAQTGSELNPQKFMQLFADDSKWQHVKGVPIFDDHTEKYAVQGPDGQPQEMVENFDIDRLQRIANNCNSLVQSGNPIGLSEGHTSDNGSESAQPQTLGYAHNYRVAMHPVLQKYCIFHDEKYFPEKYETAKSLPYRSVERWKPSAEDGGDYFKPVALLRREPRRKLGPVAYRSPTGATVVRYAMPMEEEKVDIKKPEGEKPSAPPGGGAPKIEAPPMGQEPTPPAAPVGVQQDLEPSDKDKQLFSKMCEGHPHLGPMMKEYAAKSGMPATPPAVGAGGQPPAPGMTPPATPPMQNSMGGAPAMPSGANTNIPKPGAYAMSGEVERYAALESEVEELKRANRVMRYGSDYRQLADQGYPIDPVEETTRDQNYTQDQHDQRIADIKKYAAGNQRPLGKMPRIDGSPNPAGNDRMTKEQMQKALKKQAENPGMSTAEAIKYAMNGTAVR